MRTFRFRIYPSDAQIDMLNSTLDLCRELYNAMLQQRIYAYRSGKKVIYNSQQDEIPEIKNAFPECRNKYTQYGTDKDREGHSRIHSRGDRSSANGNSGR